MIATKIWDCLSLVTFLLLFLSASMVSAQEPKTPQPADSEPAEPKAADSVPLQNGNATTWQIPEFQMAFKTLGGRQFWGDRYFFRGWRIQHNTLFNHHRLLDKNDYSYVSGTYQECLEKLEEIKQQQELKPMSGRAVVFLHGIMRSSKSFSAMMQTFAKSGDIVVPVDYPSTQVSLKLSAAYLNNVLRSLDGIDEIDIICHSMGGLVVRKYLEDFSDPRIKRLIMIGTPNNGSEMANLLQKNVFYKAIMGPAGQDLIYEKDGVIANLPVPNFEFAIVAGARGDENGYNPILPGDDDGTVSVQSARLEGATDFITAPKLHSFIMQDKDVIANCVRYIQTGAFRESGKREPLRRVENENAAAQ